MIGAILKLLFAFILPLWWNKAIVYAQNETQLLSLNDIIATDPNFSTLNAAITASGLNVSGAFDAAITLFAPNNAAFAAINDVVETLLDPQYIAHLQNVLLLHVVDGEVLSTDLMNGQVVQTVNTESIEINIDGGNVTILAPNSNATVVAVDTVSTDGVLHTIDTVLLPEFVTNDILSLAGTVDGFTILVELLNLTGLASLFGPNLTVTVFAPTDDAFMELGDEALDYYKSNPNVTSLLLAGHVITPAIVPTQNMVDGSPIEFPTSAGTTLNVGIIEEVDGPVYTINNVTIVTPNVLASKGIIHALSGVLAVPGTEFPPLNTTTAPVAAPLAAPVEEPVETPVAEPVAAPVPAPAAAPAKAPATAPAKAPVAAPAKAPVAAPATTPVAPTTSSAESEKTLFYTSVVTMSISTFLFAFLE